MLSTAAVLSLGSFGSARDLGTPSPQSVPQLTAAGRRLWALEGLLRLQFHSRPVAVDTSHQDAVDLVPCPSGGCTPLARYAPYWYTFADVSSSPFHLAQQDSDRLFFGNYPEPVLIKGRLIGCNARSTLYLVAYADARSFTLDCLAPRPSPGSTAQRSMPSALSSAIRRTEAMSRLVVSTNTKLGSVSQGTSVSEYAAPRSEESIPRTVRVGAQTFGSSITIGPHTWTRFSLPHPYLYVEVTDPPRQISIQQSLFYPLSLAARAERYVATRTGWWFGAKTFTGSIDTAGQHVGKVTVSFVTKLAGRTTQEVITCMYHQAVHAAPIIPPPSSVVLRSTSHRAVLLPAAGTPTTRMRRM